ncbi:MAG TPA: glutathione S-transferase [Gallionella sp.]|nr:glutathione S-transferase [Gallionella sp.]
MANNEALRPPLAASDECKPAVLYSFRRCPYAIRARLALCATGVEVELREVALRDKPESMLAASPKGSVPVLVLPDGCVIDESWEIMLWALHRNDPEGWLGKNDVCVNAATELVIENDTVFKILLDRYKYAGRYPEYPRSHYRSEAEIILLQLESRLSATRYLLGDTMSIADVAIFPFIRQFSEVDRQWFAQAPYTSLQRWLNEFLDSERFAAVMKKYHVWHPGDPTVIMAD